MIPENEMPGLEEAERVPEPSLYPVSEEAHNKLVSWCQNAFIAAESARSSYDDRWRRYYKLYRSHIERKPGDWRSTIFVPITFWIIETITPRLVAQLPKFTAYPVGPEDEQPAQRMEQLLDWAVKQSDLYVELVKAFKSALKYGTGILKTYHRTDIRRARKKQDIQMPLRLPQEVPMLDPDDGQPMFDLDGVPMVEIRDVDMGMMPMEGIPQKYTYTGYDGPAAECIDIFNFWVAPEAHDIDTARYVIHRVYKEMSYIQDKVKEGIYTKPENFSWDELADVSNQPDLERLMSIGLSGNADDPTRRPVELLEFWTSDGRKIVMANRKAILQVTENPFDHSEKPFIRIVDYVQEHEFWGVGEIEPLEGLQDLQNAMYNQRIDNVRLVLDAMFAVNPQYVESIKDFEMRPGGMIRLKTDIEPKMVFSRIDVGDVTGSAFTEGEIVERTVEKVSGVSNYQMGLDSPSQNSTATGVAIIQEQGASRFGLKSKMAELMGLRRLGRHYGSILQQFTTEDRWIRMTGPEGQMMFDHFAPDSLYGALDYDIESESTTQTQTVRENQKQNLLGLMATYNPMGVGAALEDLLDVMGVKDKSRYLGTPAPQALPPGSGGEGVDPGTAAPPLDPYMQAQMSGYDQYSPATGTGGEASADQRMAELAAMYNQQAQA